VPFTVYRKTASYAGWETIPGYLGNINQTIYAYELSDQNDPASYTSTSLGSALSDLSTPHTISIRRPTKRWLAMKEQYQRDHYNLWDGLNHYFTMVLDSYYGETPHALAVIKVAPVQFHPLPKDIEMKTFDKNLGTHGALLWTAGTFDISSSSIDNTLFFAATYTNTFRVTGGGVPYTYYEPNTTTSYSGVNVFGLRFEAPGAEEENDPRTDITTPGYTMNHNVYILSNVMLRTSTRLFIGPGEAMSIGTFKANKDKDDIPPPNVFTIEPNSNYEFPTITIIYTP
jgi:hypothetical protein